MYRPEFVSDFSSISASGAQWIVSNTGWQLIGLDYLSVTTYEDNTVGHQLMLGKVSSCRDKPQKSCCFVCQHGNRRLHSRCCSMSTGCSGSNAQRPAASMHV